MLLKLRLARIIPPSHIRGKRADPVLNSNKINKDWLHVCFQPVWRGTLGASNPDFSSRRNSSTNQAIDAVTNASVVPQECLSRSRPRL